MPEIKLKRIYDPYAAGDGYRVLVDKMWPRGLKKADAKIDVWRKDLAPSDALRRLFCHDPAHWPEFKRRYFAELAAKEELLRPLREQAATRPVTLLYAARDVTYNNAAALKEYLEHGSEGLTGAADAGQ